jgi:hypothetical protein
MASEKSSANALGKGNEPPNYNRSKCSTAKSEKDMRTHIVADKKRPQEI